PLTCAASRAAAANRRSGRAILPASAALTARRATRSRTSTGAATPIRQRPLTHRTAQAPCKEQRKYRGVPVTIWKAVGKSRTPDKITGHNRPITGTRDAVACRRKFRAGHLSFFHCRSRARKRRAASAGAAPTASVILVSTESWKILVTRVKRNFRSRPESVSSPLPTAAAPHLARAAAIEIIKHRGHAAAVPVARDEPDPLTRRPS